MTKDSQLIGRLGRGDREALREVYEQHKDGLLTVAACLLGDVGLAEDMLHDVFVTFAASVGGLRIRGSLKSYLSVSVANRARDVLRRKSRQDVPLTALADPADRQQGPVDRVIADEQAIRLVAALAEVPYEQREAIVLHLQAGMTFRRIAGQQGVSTNTAKSRYRYGLDKLRSLLDAGVKQ